jgi:hypothetical protein
MQRRSEISSSREVKRGVARHKARERKADDGPVPQGEVNGRVARTATCSCLLLKAAAVENGET